MTQRSLRAWINEDEVGTLTDREGIWCFEYAPTNNATSTRSGDRLRVESALPCRLDSSQLPVHSSNPYAGGPMTSTSATSCPLRGKLGQN